MKYHIHNTSCFFDTKIQGYETSVSHQNNTVACYLLTVNATQVF